jgi:hypothetical protein
MGPTARAAILWVQCQENNSQQLVAESARCNGPSGKDMDSSGKIMGFVARDGDVCRRRLSASIEEFDTLGALTFRESPHLVADCSPYLGKSRFWLLGLK